MIFSILLHLYKLTLHIFPAQFRADFAPEMVEVFQNVLAQQARHGSVALLVVGWREFYQLPAALWRTHLATWQRKGERPFPFRYISRSPFHPIPAAHDGRFSWWQLFWELLPFIVTAVGLFLLTYQRPVWIPGNWQQQWPGLGWFVALFVTPILLWGLGRELPRWAYPWGGLLLGYSLLLALEYRLSSLWVWLLLAVFALALATMHTHLHHEPLPPFWQRIGRSLALDWTRLCFGLYALTPWLLIAVFDGVYRTDRTPYMALSLLLLVLGALVYGRCRRQQQQWVVLVTAVSITLLPSLLHQAAFYGGVWRWLADPSLWLAELSWTGLLWALMIILLLLPLLGRLVYQIWAEDSTITDDEGIHL
ncbi:MAG TPA: hypothetical protein PLK31_15135 [Chloroflexota bacterium]|nr:hypothetical protein [Chloroflexota bacterium]